MAYFECIIGSGGSSTDIPLTVTCTSGFAGETITCTDGTTTLTGTCPSSSPYTLVFHLPNAGTWDVSGNAGGTTYTESINADSFEVDLKDNITETITLYSAANDTVSYTGLDGATHTITTNSSGEATATITIAPSGSTFTFTSSVAKNPDSLSSNYTKSITITSSTSSIYVMPGTCAYWYGYKIGSLTNIKLLSNYTNVGQAITLNTNSASFTSAPTANSSAKASVFDNSIDMTSKTNVKAIVDNSLKQGSISITGYKYLAVTQVCSASGGKNRYVEILSEASNAPTREKMLVCGETASTINAIWVE